MVVLGPTFIQLPALVREAFCVRTLQERKQEKTESRNRRDVVVCVCFRGDVTLLEQEDIGRGGMKCDFCAALQEVSTELCWVAEH